VRVTAILLLDINRPATASKYRDLGDVAGFHLYRRELDALANAAEGHARRGAAFTFNAAKFVERIRDISRASTMPGSPPVLLPSFDHNMGDPVEDDICILPEHRLVIVEGIYVLRGAAL
jgi:pantothenate kinase